jgi:hypothetical protein
MRTTSLFDLHLWGILALSLVLVLSRFRGKAETTSASARAIIGRLAVCCAIMIGGVVALNYVVNPFGYYPTDVIKPLTFFSRQEKLRLWSRLNAKTDVVILGSSRSFTLPPAQITKLTGRSAFNASFHWGTPRDYVAFTRYLIERKQVPRVMIVGLSLDQMWSAPETALEANDPLRKYVGSVDSQETTIKQLQALISLEQTEQSLRSLLLEITGRGERIYGFDGDGLGHFYKTPPLDEAVATYMNTPGQTDIPGAFDSAQVDYLRTFLTLCKEQNIFVVFYLPPYHTRLLDFYLNQENSAFVTAKNELLDMLAGWKSENNYQFTIHDFSDIKSFAGEPSMFTDAIHSSEAAGRLMIGVMVSDFPAEKR